MARGHPRGCPGRLRGPDPTLQRLGRGNPLRLPCCWGTEADAVNRVATGTGPTSFCMRIIGLIPRQGNRKGLPLPRHFPVPSNRAGPVWIDFLLRCDLEGMRRDIPGDCPAACDDLDRRCNVWVGAIPCGCPATGVRESCPSLVTGHSHLDDGRSMEGQAINWTGSIPSPPYFRYFGKDIQWVDG